MNKLTAHKSSLPQPSGDLLVADFQTALANLVTADIATAEAAHTEADIENALKYNQPKNGVFLTPGDISPDIADTLVKTSLDAHLKKVQASQISSYTAQQVTQQQQELSETYKGRKVQITNISNLKDVFIPIWQNPHTGQLREGTYKSKSLKGVIEEISIEKNLLVVKPTFLWRTIQPDRKYFLIVVINMNTMQPNINVSLI